MSNFTNTMGILETVKGLLSSIDQDALKDTPEIESDLLGMIKSVASDLSSMEKSLKSDLIESEQTEINGSLFRTTISLVESDKVAWQKVALKLNPSRQLITANTKKSESYRVSVKALIK